MSDASVFRTSALLRSLGQSASGEAAADETLRLEELLTRFRQRAYGVLLIAVLLPAFLPLPIGAGAVSGPLTCLIGLQLLLGLPQPWLPGVLRRRGVARSGFTRFMDRIEPWLLRLETLCRPRWAALLSPLGNAVTGMLVLLLGVLLSLPIPLTNYPFGLLLVLFAIAMIERDGLLLLVAWTLGTGVVVGAALLSDGAAGWAAELLARA